MNQPAVVNCTQCVHVEARPQTDSNGRPVVGQTSYICRFMPPSPVALAQPDGQPVIVPMFPPVGPDLVCAQFRPHPSENGQG